MRAIHPGMSGRRVAGAIGLDDEGDTGASYRPYVKIPGMLFWTSIVPPDPGGWNGTRIGKRGTLRQRNQVMKEPAAGFLKDRIELFNKRIK